MRRFEWMLSVLVCLSSTACTKHTNISVIYFTVNWEIGEEKDCQLTKMRRYRDGATLDRLVCSMSDYNTNLMLVGAANSPEAIHLREAVNDPKTFAVSFRGSGEPSIYEDSTDWKCRKTVDGIDCK